MKIRAVNIAEMVFYVIFVVATIITKQKVARLGFVAIPAFLALGALYFPLGYYTIKSAKINTTFSVLYGLLFSLSLTAVFFRILKAKFAVILLLVFVIIFLVLAAVEIITTTFFKRPDGKIMPHDPALLIRFIVLFITMVVALVSY